MTSVYFYTTISVLIVSLVSFTGIFTLSLNDKVLRRSIFVLVSLAAGALLGDALLHLVPEAFEKGGITPRISLLVIGGILLFFIIEKFFHWHHFHGREEEEAHEHLHEHLSPEALHRQVHPIGQMILFSDGFHNFIDGLIIGASYLVSIEVGIATTIAIILHEIPQEIGDFGVLLHAGYSKGKALFFNFLSALSSVVGAGLALALGGVGENFIALIIPIAAGGFIYVAGSDLIPELHKTTDLGRSLVQLLGIIAGVLAMFLLLLLN